MAGVENRDDSDADVDPLCMYDTHSDEQQHYDHIATWEIAISTQVRESLQHAAVSTAVLGRRAILGVSRRRWTVVNHVVLTVTTVAVLLLV